MEKKRENIYQKSETVLKKREQKRQNWNRRSLIGSLCSFAYWFMLVLTLLAVLADVTNFLRYGQTLGLRHLLENCVQTALVLWMILALIVVLLSAIQICRIRHGMWNMFRRESRRRHVRGARHRKRSRYPLQNAIGTGSLCLWAAA